jgi:hypothetical protein
MPSLQNREKSVLCVYAATQTFTATVFEHLDAFRKYSGFTWRFADISLLDSLDLSGFDALVVHYGVRLPFGNLTATHIEKLNAYDSLKVLFIQDEYDNTNRAKEVIKASGIGLVFSVVPPQSLALVYPPEEFPGTRFVSNLTGYVPGELEQSVGPLPPPSRRSLLVAYRGRSLPVRYGRMGMDKIEVGRRVKEYCLRRGLPCNIAWDEQSRIYGADWYRFIASARSMLGTESGSNVFDWDGNLQVRLDAYRQDHPEVTDDDLYREVVALEERDGLMNQLSPRIFEMAAAKTVMVLLEGAYSNALTPIKHYVPLKKDYSNLDEVFTFLANDQAVDEMAERAYSDVIGSKVYGYSAFVQMVDREMAQAMAAMPSTRALRETQFRDVQLGVTTAPIRAKPVLPGVLTASPWIVVRLMGTIMLFVWCRIPIRLRPYIKRLLGRV